MFLHDSLPLVLDCDLRILIRVALWLREELEGNWLKKLLVLVTAAKRSDFIFVAHLLLRTLVGSRIAILQKSWALRSRMDILLKLSQDILFRGLLFGPVSSKDFLNYRIVLDCKRSLGRWQIFYKVWMLSLCCYDDDLLGLFVLGVYPFDNGSPALVILLEAKHEFIRFDNEHWGQGGRAFDCCCVISLVDNILFAEHLAGAQLLEHDHLAGFFLLVQRKPDLLLNSGWIL